MQSDYESQHVHESVRRGAPHPIGGLFFGLGFLAVFGGFHSGSSRSSCFFEAEPMADLPLAPMPEFIGPFERHEVVVNGWKVPHVDADLLPGGRVHLCLDNRYGIDLTVDEANRFVPFLADCIAVAMGYTCHPREDWEAPIARPPFVRMHGIDLTTNDGQGERS